MIRSIKEMGEEATRELDKIGATTNLRMTISSGSGETRLRQAAVYVLPKFDQEEPTLHAVLTLAQVLDRWVKQYAPDRKDWVVMPFEYFNDWPPNVKFFSEDD